MYLNTEASDLKLDLFDFSGQIKEDISKKDLCCVHIEDCDFHKAHFQSMIT
jgi:hypothetical protein